MSNRAGANAIANSDKKCSNDLDCDICLEQVKDPVVTFCGHLYCWSCIYKWINSTSWEHNVKPECPVCKVEISESTVVPLYGRGHTSSTAQGEVQRDGSVVPPRPSGPRSFHSTPNVSEQPQQEQINIREWVALFLKIWPI
ncbi:E3 ubiquitin-protein ligase RMA1H1-like [Trifolium pratense]|uniref:E3 ubiquitin-protein ligase RMA1H1-like n=1 Tax=Trifolium pratense TaxID=57577 RepID=UPI001E690300|nr:E3 ubiquitin-protein ligase RMA1H1-like [Trifolium pratense]